MNRVIFEKVADSASGKTALFGVYNVAGECLGSVTFNSEWRQYVFVPKSSMTIYWAQDCLAEVSEFLKAKTAEHRAKNEERRKPTPQPCDACRVGNGFCICGRRGVCD